MPYSNIMVHLDAGRRAMHRLELAAGLARDHGARLIGLYAGFMPDPAWFYLMEGAEIVLEADRRRRQEIREVVRRQFEACMHAFGLERAQWRVVEGVLPSAVVRETREADLIVAGQYDSEDPGSYVAPQFVESLVLESGRPVLVVPYAGTFETVGRRAVLAWNGSGQSARALHDAVPLLAGGAVTVISVEEELRPPHVDTSPVEQALTALGDHGIQARAESALCDDDMAVAEFLLSRTADCGADMIVMGAYGRGRLREMVLGGVTRTMLAAMTVPVLMSH